MNVYFICRGNVLRSLIAETYLKSLDIIGVSVVSSGTNVNMNDPQEREYFASTIGEGHRTDSESRESYEQEIFQEIKNKVDDLVKVGLQF